MSLARAATAHFADRLRQDDVLAIYQFADEVKQLQEFTSLRDVSDYVWDAEAEGYTRMYDCLADAVEALGKREERRRAALVISDGMDTRSRRNLDEVLKRALAANVAIYTVDLIGSAAGGATARVEEVQGRNILKQMAEKTGGRYLRSPGGTQLSESLLKIIEELTNQYTLGYYPSNEKRDGKWRRVEVALPRASVNIHARTGYYAPKD